MAWLEVQWKCVSCGYVQREFLGQRPTNISARCRSCKAQHHLDITPKVTVSLWDKEQDSE